MHVVLSIAKKFQARKWITEEYLSVIFSDDREPLVSINSDEFYSNMKYNEELKEFFKPILTQKGIMKIGLFGKAKYSTYASVVGISNKKPLESNKNKRYKNRRRLNKKAIKKIN